MLGVEDYGIYGVVGGVVAMLGFLNASMSGATSRFLTFELGRGDQKRLADTFSSALIVHIGIAVIVLIVAETVGLWFLNHKLVIPESRMPAAHWVYQCSIISAMLNITQVPYNAAIIAHEKMDVYAYVEILNVTLKLLIVYLLTIGNFDKLIFYAILVLAVSALVMMVYRFFCLRHFQESHFHLIWDKAIIKPLLSFSGWDLYGNICLTTRQQGFKFIINIFFGVIYNAADNIASTVMGFLLALSQNITTAFRPQIIKLYSTEQYKDSIELMNKSSRLSTLLLGLLCVPLLFNTDEVLTIWLIHPPESSALFCKIFIVTCMLNIMAVNLQIGIHATGNIKLFSFVTGCFHLSVLPLVLIIYKMGAPVHWGFWVSVMITFFVLLFDIILVKKKIPDFSVYGYIKYVVFPIVSSLVLSMIILYILRLVFIHNSLWTLMIDFTITLCVFFIIGLNHQERNQLRHIVANKIGSIYDNHFKFKKRD